MADVLRSESGMPRTHLWRTDDLVGRIEALISDANAQGYGSIAYFLEMARTEARIQLGREDDGQRAPDGGPKGGWRLRR